MIEKIKIMIPKSIYDTLIKDIETFKIFKKNGELNKNEFFNRLIKNYVDDYQSKITSLEDNISKILIDKKIFSNVELSKKLSKEVISSLDLESDVKEKMEYSISIKPLVDTIGIFEYIESNLLYNDTLSSYLRKLFRSYIKLSISERERLIFKDKFELIENAIKNKHLLFLQTQLSQLDIYLPIDLIPSKEEIHYYLIAQHVKSKRLFTFQVCKLQIKKVIMDKEEHLLTEDNLRALDRIKTNSPLYVDNFYFEGDIKVKLSAKGKKLFTKIYLYRPTPIKIEDNIYYFNCSTDHIIYYFVHFGKEVVVLEPQFLINKLRYFYYQALNVILNVRRNNFLLTFFNLLEHKV